MVLSEIDANLNWLFFSLPTADVFLVVASRRERGEDRKYVCCSQASHFYDSTV